MVFILFFVLLIPLYNVVESTLSVSFVLDPEPPRIGGGGFFPPPDTIIPETTLTISADVIDLGAGVWRDYIASSSEWGDSVFSFITWSVNGAGFADTIRDAFSFTRTFSNRDTVEVCINAIDEIHNYDCSCPPNILHTCWSFICCVPNANPQVWDVNFAQATDGSHLVDIYYFADDENSDPVRIHLEVSNDGGLTWDVVDLVTFISPSDTGWVEASDTERRHIIWDMGTDYPECFFEESDIMVRVWGDDGIYYRCE